MQRFIGAVAEAGIHAEGLVRSGDDLRHCEAHGGRQALPAIGRIAGDRGPAAVAELLVGFLEALGRAHHAVLVGAALLVARAVERKQHVLADLRCFLEDGVDGVGRRVLVTRQLRQARHVEHFVEHEAHILQRRFVNGHRHLLSGFQSFSGSTPRCFSSATTWVSTSLNSAICASRSRRLRSSSPI